MNDPLRGFPYQPAKCLLGERSPETKKQRIRRQKNAWARRDRLRKRKDAEQLEKDTKIKMKINEEYQRQISQLKTLKLYFIATLQQHACTLRMLPPIPLSQPRQNPLSPCCSSSNAATSDHDKNTGNHLGNRDESPPVRKSRAFTIREVNHCPVRSASSSVNVTNEEQGREEECNVVEKQAGSANEDYCWLDGPLPLFTYSDTEKAASFIQQLLETATPGAGERQTGSVPAGKPKPQPSIAMDHELKTSTILAYEPEMATAKPFEPKTDFAVVYEQQIGTAFSYQPKTDSATAAEPKTSFAAMAMEPETSFAVTRQSEASTAMTGEPWQSFRREQQLEPVVTGSFPWQQQPHCQTSSSCPEDLLWEPLTQELPIDLSVMMLLYDVNLTMTS